jgi:WS/DGAT/MGAT family acyltransferase
MAPWRSAPRSAINTPVDCGRRFVAQSWPFERIYRLGKAFDGTLNDAVLAMCGGALRKYLQHHAHLPEKTLSAMVPVSLRRKGDVESGNAVGAVIADLATEIDDPAERMARVQRSMIAGKQLYKDVSPDQAALLMALMQTPMFLLSALSLSDRFPSVSTVISNVPGPRHPLYWNGAQLKGMYPASIVLDGFALNITLVGYDKSLDFGIVAARRTMPQVQRLIDYLEDALVELEDAAGLGAAPKRTRRTTSLAAKTTTKKKAEAKPEGRAEQAVPRKSAAKKPAAKKAKAGAPAKARRKVTPAAKKASPKNPVS